MLRNFCFPAKQNIPSIVSIVQTEKVILLTYEYPPTRGGAGIYCEELGYAASDVGFNFEVWPPLDSASSTEVKSSLRYGIPRPIEFVSPDNGTVGASKLIELFSCILQNLAPFEPSYAFAPCLNPFRPTLLPYMARN